MILRAWEGEGETGEEDGRRGEAEETEDGEELKHGGAGASGSLRDLRASATPR